MEFLVQKGKIPYAWQEALTSTSAVSRVYIILLSDKILDLAPVVQKLDSAIHRINHYPVDNAIGFPNTYPLDSGLSGG